MKLQPIFNKIFNRSIYQLIFLLFLTNFILIGLAVSFYNGHFLFLQYPFSFAGQVRTEAGLPNFISMRFYSLDMFLSGLIMATIAYLFYKQARTNGHIFKFLTATVCSLGFIIASFNPNDTRHPFHVLGSALIVATIWILATNYLFEIRHKIAKWKYFLFQTSLQLPVFAYAITYFSNLDIPSAILQKVTILSFSITLLSVVKYSD